MTKPRRFSDEILSVLGKSKGLRIRAGTGTHRFTGIWMVVVKERVFVRSWSVRSTGWYRAFLKEPKGVIRVGDHAMAVRAVRVTNKLLRDAIDKAYLDKYNTPGSVNYAKDLGQPKSRATTIELVPFAG